MATGENYIASQKGNGWVCLPQHYDDGGFSGGNTNRPALQQLLADIKDGKIDMVVVYKIDRLSRSIYDFGELQTVFEEYLGELKIMLTRSLFLSKTQVFYHQ